MANHSSSTSTQSRASSSPVSPSASVTASPKSSTISVSDRSTSAPVQPSDVLTKAAEKVFAMCAPESVEDRFDGALERLGESESRRDAGQDLVRQQVDVAGEDAELHLVEPEVREDR